MSDLVLYDKRGAIGLITVDNPPVNALSVGVPQGIMERLEEGGADSEIIAFVLTGGGRTYIAGADIREFGKTPDPNAKTIHDLIAALENSTKPVVAALHANALGGGLEVALACHYRVAAPGTNIGFPEVKIGLLPGAGGTQRGPRVAGVAAALDLIVSGDFIKTDRAIELGFVDEQIDGDLIDGALTYAEGTVAEGRPLRRVRDETVSMDGLADSYFDDSRAKITPESRGQIAPFRCIDCVEAAAGLPFDKGMAVERKLFQECHDSPQSKALIHAFFSERGVAKIPDVPKDTPRKTIERAGVVGAGTMGTGIAMCFLNANFPVYLVENDPEALERGLATIKKTYTRSVEKGRLSEQRMAACLGLLSSGTAWDGLADADIVIEAVFEEMDIKKQVFGQLEQVCRANAILATNTSTLDVDEIAASVADPSRVIGTHFFSPAHVMKLLENVRGAKSSFETIATVMDLGKRLGKIAALVGVCDGFVGNRILYTYLREANFLLEEGALPQDVDRVMVEFGMPMGPFTMGDLTGLDVGWRIRKGRAARRPQNLRYAAVGDKICEMGRFGQKTGAGWYRYEAGDYTPHPDPEVEALIVAESELLGIERRAIDDSEILERCVYPMINEGAKTLEEGIALRSSDIDVVWLNGYGFPRWRGGPMFYGDEIGLDVIYDVVRRNFEAHGEWWEPAPLLARLAAEGKRFDRN
jgi:3-hydroxyacyl-CoA dehydrogenase